MAGDCGLNALSLLPENMQVQYLQKIALRAENPFVPKMTIIGTIYIFCVSNFLLPLRQLIFRQKQPGHWGRGCLPFSPYFTLRTHGKPLASLGRDLREQLLKLFKHFKPILYLCEIECPCSQTYNIPQEMERRCS